MNLRREKRASMSSVTVLLLMTDVGEDGTRLRIPDGFFNRKLPTEPRRFDDQVKDVRILLHVVDAMARAGVIDDLLQESAADRAVRVQPERGGRRLCAVRAVGRGGLPTDAQCSGVARERFGLQAAAA